MIVEFVNAGGKPRPFLFSGGAAMLYEQRNKRNFHAAFFQAISAAMTEQGVVNVAGLSVADFSELFYAGFLYGAKKEQQPQDFDALDVADWIFDDGELFATLIAAVTKFIKPEESAADESATEQKKTTGKPKPTKSRA